MRTRGRRYARALSEANKAFDARRGGHPDSLNPAVVACFVIFFILWMAGNLLY